MAIQVLIYPLGDHLAEYDPVEIERLCGVLGRFPSCTFIFALSRSKGRTAHDAAVALAAELLREFDGVLEDTSGHALWSLADLEAGRAAQAATELSPDSADPGDATGSR